MGGGTQRLRESESKSWSRNEDLSRLSIDSEEYGLDEEERKKKRRVEDDREDRED